MELEHYEDNNIWRRRYMDLLDDHVELQVWLGSVYD